MPLLQKIIHNGKMTSANQPESCAENVDNLHPVLSTDAAKVDYR